MAVKVYVNGRPEHTEGPLGLLDLLAEKKLQPEVVSVAVNKTIVRWGDFESTVLADGDEVEIMLHLSGGTARSE